jgi:NAD(P)-dependent dehydrogenase (short-subunit alcohol dehydrogenase family)
VVICARNQDELATARDELAAGGADVLALPADITDRADVQRLMRQTVEHFGGLDILVNNAGIIKVGPVMEMSADDFLTAVEVMLLGPVYLTLQALPHLREAPAGRVVNITSIGGKVPAPHLLPYVSAKFGAVGFSQGLHAELAGEGIRVTTVVPGLMRTGSHVRALFTGQADKELSWFATVAGAPLVAMDAERAARRVVDAAAAGRTEVTTTPPAVVASRLAPLAPATTARVLRMVARALPDTATGSAPTRPGAQVAERSPSRVRSALTTLGRRAANRFQPAVRGSPAT